MFSIKLLLFIEKYLYYHKNDGSASIFGMMREERSLKFKIEFWLPIIGGIMKVKMVNRLMSIIDEICVIHLQKVDTLLMIFRAPDKLRICIFYTMKTSKNACIIRSECTHYAYILLCKQTFQIRSVLVVVYITIHFCFWEIPRNYFPLYFSKERAYTSEGYRMFAFLSIDVKRDLIVCLR